MTKQKTDKRLQRYAFVLFPEQVESLDEEAEERGLSRSAIVREIVDVHIKKRKKKDNELR